MFFSSQPVIVVFGPVVFVLCRLCSGRCWCSGVWSWSFARHRSRSFYADDFLEYRKLITYCSVAFLPRKCGLAMLNWLI